MRTTKLKHASFTGTLPYFWLCLLTFISSSIAAFGQLTTPDTVFLKESVSVAVAQYRQSVEGRAHLYIGQEYVDYRIRYREGDQFFVTENFKEGVVKFEGIWYEPVSLLYDIVRDEVVLQLHPSMMKQKLISEKVSTFRIHGHTFVRLNADSLAGTKLKAGFYDLLYQQRALSLFAKRTKSLEEEIGLNLFKQIFTEQTTYYFRKDSQFFRIKNKGDLYHVLSDSKKELRRFARVNKLKFKQDKEAAFMALLQHYNNLSD